MKVLFTRPFSVKLDISLVICFALVFIGSLRCNARIINEENSAPIIEEVRSDLNSNPLPDISRVNDEPNVSENVDAVNEKRLRRVTENIGKSEKQNEGIKVRDVSGTRDSDYETHQKEVADKQTRKGDAKSFKRSFKRPIRRLKRDDENVNKEQLPLDEKLDTKDVAEKSSRIDMEGIRRLDVDVDEEKKENRDIIPNEPTVLEGQTIDEIKTVDLLEKSATISEDQSKNKQLEDSPREDAETRASNFPRLEFLKAQAVELQQKIRDNAFLQKFKEQASEIFPGFPKFTENEFLNILKAILAKKNIQESNDINNEIFKDNRLSDIQKEIIRCAQQLVVKNERQSFSDNVSECMRGLNVFNCIRIFVYPIIAENMPEALQQSLPQLPIEINVGDLLQGTRDKIKIGKTVPPIGFYANPIEPDSMIFDILMEGLLKNPPQENVTSFIEAKNETLSKLLTCNRMQILQMTEKYLPESARKQYADEMLSCVQRFEYFSCIKYFSWPEIKKYYPALPPFPINDAHLATLLYPEYPLITYPGSASGFGHLPEVIDSGPRSKPETIIMEIFKKALNENLRVPTPPTPIQLDLMLKSNILNPEQMVTIHLAEQLLPVNLRPEYISRTVECIRQYDYYNCMKYATWPVVRQFNPTIPQFPNFQELIQNFQFSDIPQIANLFDFFSQFGFPQFQLPDFNLPDFQLPQFPQFGLPEVPNFTNFTLPDFSNFSVPGISNFSLPDFSNYFTTTTTTAAPTMLNSTGSTSSKNDSKSPLPLEPKIYKILKDIRDTMGATPLSSPTYTNRKVFLFPLMTEEQSRIFAIAESILPPMAREPLITNTYFCLEKKIDFVTCSKTIIWPSIKIYVKSLPDFPQINDLVMGEEANRDIPQLASPESRDNVFMMKEVERLFSEGREDAMSFMIRSIQLSSPGDFNMQRIMQLLRSIQFKSIDFANRQIIRYPRTPEFLTILTEDQENIVHAVETIIPDGIRTKFYNDMVDCSKKFKFLICSRNVIFPSIYPYFQRALFNAYYNIIPEKRNFSTINNVDPVRMNPAKIETYINTEKQGENIVTNIDRKIPPFYPSNPELVIFGMLRKMQINAESLPDFPKQSIAYSPEFKQAFSMRQAHILTVAEGILPEAYRKNFLSDMCECDQKNSFLNCARDIMFPLMKKAYPDFPDFPDFKNDLNRANMLMTIDDLKKPSSSPRSYDSKRNLPYMDVLIKFVPEDKTDGLKLLVDKLPDTLYYDLYVKMVQCGQFSDGISCGHDIIYPMLKQYYDAPNFNVDDYYPIRSFFSSTVNQHSPIDYEIVCENFGFACTLIPFGSRTQLGITPNIAITSSHPEFSFIPFGKLSDGSRIFKQTQDMWNPNISPSVGTNKVNAPEQSGYLSASDLNLKRRSTRTTNQRKLYAHNARSSINHNFNRSKRNVDDLLDSYPHAIPGDEKTSVPRRIPPKLTFPNITETDILLILNHISKKNIVRISQNEKSSLNEYFVDTLNDTDKALITAEQYEILKLVQGINSETAKASFMSQVIRCIRSLSFIRCIGIFVWPMIASNLPFNLPPRDSRLEDGIQLQEVLGISSSEFEEELISRKREIEANLIEWYKSLITDKFEKTVGPLKINGHGDGELSVSLSGYREGRLSKFRDHKNLPSILTIISDVIEEVFDTKPDKSRIRKEKKEKRERSLRSSGENFSDESSKNFNGEKTNRRWMKDDQVINMLLDKLRPAEENVAEEEIRHHIGIEGAYRAFQMLFGPKISEKISDKLKSMNVESRRHNHERYETSKSDEELDLIPLEGQEKNSAEESDNPLLKGRAMHDFDSAGEKSNVSKEESVATEKLLKLKAYLSDYLKRYLVISEKKAQTALTFRLPRLNDKIISRKITSSISNIGRKMPQMVPAAGLTVSFLVQLALAHAKAIASVAGLMSNMALGSAMIGMIRDMIFGMNQETKIKYIYDTEKHDAGISWPHVGSNSAMSYAPTNKAYTPSPNFHY